MGQQVGPALSKLAQPPTAEARSSSVSSRH